MKCPNGFEYVKSYRKRDGTYVKGFCREASRKAKLKEYKSGTYKLPDGTYITKDGNEYVLMGMDYSVNAPYDIDVFKTKKEVNDYIKKANEEYKRDLKFENSSFKDYLKENHMTPKEYMRRK